MQADTGWQMQMQAGRAGWQAPGMQMQMQAAPRMEMQMQARMQMQAGRHMNPVTQ